MKVNSLEDLFVHELKDLYSAEKQLIKALPKMAKGATSEKLKEAIQEHLEETKGQVERLEKIFESLDKTGRGVTCKAMQGLVEEGSETLELDTEDVLRDAAIIAAAQRVEHYEMAGYGTARAYAELLGLDDAARLLQETLDEEKAADEKLNELAMSEINVEAKAAG
ncbi:MAG TPA: ferritin-like domain-containing protein [Pirellulales bacterium]|jgi:ferritin-like metal-binding protein YciE|nr:ferritin-like domain-containing protein [Pirellulales bacterium]